MPALLLRTNPLVPPTNKEARERKWNKHFCIIIITMTKIMTKIISIITTTMTKIKKNNNENNNSHTFI